MRTSLWPRIALQLLDASEPHISLKIALEFAFFAGKRGFEVPTYRRVNNFPRYHNDSHEARTRAALASWPVNPQTTNWNLGRRRSRYFSRSKDGGEVFFHGGTGDKVLPCHPFQLSLLAGKQARYLVATPRY